MKEKERYKDNQDGTITDTQNGLIWSRKDSWQKNSQWVSWDEAKDFIRELCNANLGGYNDWRLPRIEEAQNLYDPSQTNKDKYGKEIHLPPLFPEGSLATIWCDDLGGGSTGDTLNFQTGELGTLYKSKAPRMAARAVRGKIQTHKPVTTKVSKTISHN